MTDILDVLISFCGATVQWPCEAAGLARSQNYKIIHPAKLQAFWTTLVWTNQCPTRMYWQLCQEPTGVVYCLVCVTTWENWLFAKKTTCWLLNEVSRHGASIVDWTGWGLPLIDDNRQMVNPITCQVFFECACPFRRLPRWLTVMTESILNMHHTNNTSVATGGAF